MIEKIKNIGNGVLGMLFLFLILTAPILLLLGGVKLFELLYPFLETISVINWSLVWLLLLFSVIPKFRDVTGGGIIIGTYIGGAIFWLLCLYITFSLWGFLGVLVGVLFFGLGVFVTAVLALIFDGQFIEALIFAFILAQIFFFRFLGFWIAEKYRGGKHVIQESNSLELTEGESNSEYYADTGDEDQPEYCSNCGAKVRREGFAFCPECGNKL